MSEEIDKTKITRKSEEDDDYIYDQDDWIMEIWNSEYKIRMVANWLTGYVIGIATTVLLVAGACWYLSV